jgi:hypothetical protein
LNPKKNNRKPPSLLMEEGNAASISSDNVIPSQQHNAEKSPFQKRSQYFFPTLCVLALSTVGLTIYALPYSYNASQTAAIPSAEGIVVDRQDTAYAPIASPLTAPKLAIPAEHSTPILSSAIIVNEQPSALPKPVVDISPPPVKTVENTALKPSVSPTQAPQRAISVRAKPTPSSDIDVLIALMRYSEDGKSSKLIDLQELLDKCPAPNTKPGIQCRQNICAKKNGDSTLCPIAADH